VAVVSHGPPWMTVSIEEQGEKGRNWTNSPEKSR